MVKFAKNIKHIPPAEIIVPPDRQRKEITTEDLEPSIAERGIYNPIIIKRDYTLVAGERRLRTALKLGLPTVPTRFADELDEIESKIVELEENERRQALNWMDHVRAVNDLHNLYTLKAGEEGWSQERTAEMLFYSQGLVSRIIRVARDIDSPKIANAPGIAAAYNVLMRQDERRIGDAMSEIAGAAKAQTAPKPAPAAKLEPGEIPQPVAAPAQPKPAFMPPEQSIINVDCIEWMANYSGPKFNFVHMDFPYGTNLFGGAQGGKNGAEQYDDDPDVYWRLIRAFCAHRERFLAASSHLMFWFDMDYYTDTLALFEELAPEIQFHRKPLIWHKTNNMGILPDPKRGPRHVYETCLFAAREDRYIVKAKSDAYGCHTDKDYHPSTKPEAMLRQFMEMFVDEHTRLLDPTCGSGASLRAAESLGAAFVFGIERDKEFHASACSALRQFRAKALASKLTAKKVG